MAEFILETNYPRTDNQFLVLYYYMKNYCNLIVLEQWYYNYQVYGAFLSIHACVFEGIMYENEIETNIT